MAVKRLFYLQFLPDLDARALGPALVQHLIGKADDVVLEREGHESREEDDHPAREHLETLADRDLAHRQSAGNEHQERDQVNEFSGLVGAVHSATS
jgi:hypothetical protein